LDEKSVADMSRAKAMKSLFRIITPHLTTKDLPCIVVNHTYQTIELFSKTVVSGGCLAEGTKILMADDSLKSIEHIMPGDTVKTLFGPKEVTHSWNPDTLVDGEPECFEIEFDDGHKIICSENHMFLVNDMWIKAKDIVSGVKVKLYK
jgi:hypothetical protein